MSPQAVRPLALTAMVGGALYVIAGFVQLTSPEQSAPFSRMSDYLIEAVLALSLLLTLAGFVALHLLLRAGGYRGLRGSTGFRAAVLGQGAMLASTVASLIAGAAALGFLYFAGTLVLLVGLALLSVATHRAALLPGWSPYLVGALAVGVLGEFGMVVVGVVWITLGYVLRSLRGGGGGPFLARCVTIQEFDFHELRLIRVGRRASAQRPGPLTEADPLLPLSSGKSPRLPCALPP